MPLRLPLLEPAADAPFPPAELALRQPNGLLAFGGDLSPTRLLNAYRDGIFPWFSEGEPILWWSPDPRMVLIPEQLHLGRRLRRSLRQSDWQVAADQDFGAVIDHCARLPRNGQPGTWITTSMRAAYIEMHRLGHAHSIEVRDSAGALIGGLYGLAIGHVFFGESMFSLRSGGSQAACAALCLRLQEWGYALLDGQVESAHLATLGFRPLPRREFLDICRRASATAVPSGNWHLRFGHLLVADLT